MLKAEKRNAEKSGRFVYLFTYYNIFWHLQLFLSPSPLRTQRLLVRIVFLSSLLKSTSFLDENHAHTHTYTHTHTHTHTKHNLELCFDVVYRKRFIHIRATTHTKHLKNATMPIHTYTLSYSYRKREYLTSHLLTVHFFRRSSFQTSKHF